MHRSNWVVEERVAHIDNASYWLNRALECFMLVKPEHHIASQCYRASFMWVEQEQIIQFVDRMAALVQITFT